jgi:hypothetical protein
LAPQSPRARASPDIYLDPADELLVDPDLDRQIAAMIKPTVWQDRPGMATLDSGQIMPALGSPHILMVGLDRAAQDDQQLEQPERKRLGGLAGCQR